MHRLASTMGLLGLCVIVGGIVAARLAAVPILEAESGLLDLNLGTAIARTLMLRTAELALIGALIHAAVTVPRAPRSGRATLALLLLGGCLVERAWAAPSLYAAWARIDRVAGLPRARLDEAERLAFQHDALLLGIVLLCATALWLGLGGTLEQKQPATDGQGRQ